jgi:hypothetical protein
MRIRAILFDRDILQLKMRTSRAIIPIVGEANAERCVFVDVHPVGSPVSRTFGFK